MHQLSALEINEVSGGGGYGQTVGTTALVSGSAAIGSYLSAARMGAALGSAAGPLGAFADAVAGATAAYFYYHYTSE
jgi:hypothetical protein